MSKERIQVYVDSDTKKRVELGAARQEVSVTRYCLDAIQQKLDEENLLNKDEITVPVDRKTHQLQVINRIQSLREQTLERREGAELEIDSVIQDLRDEQTRSAAGMH